MCVHTIHIIFVEMNELALYVRPSEVHGYHMGLSSVGVTVM